MVIKTKFTRIMGNLIYKKGFILISLVIAIMSISRAAVWPMPVGQEDAPITSAFGPRLYANRYDFHQGIDIRIWNSQIVVATHWSSVVFAGYVNDIQRNKIVLLDENNYEFATGYLHLSNLYNGLFDDNGTPLMTEVGYYYSEGDQIATINHNDDGIVLNYQDEE